MVGKTRPYAHIIQLTMPIPQLPIPNFIFHIVYGRGGLRDCLFEAIMVGKTRPYAHIIQLTMPISQLPITNFIFLMTLALI